MYRLVIAEKPSVAMSIAKVLGATARKEGHMEGGGWPNLLSTIPTMTSGGGRTCPSCRKTGGSPSARINGSSSTSCGRCCAGRMCRRW